ncbi:hypothetical protein [Parasediminibacterium sp. JCM 36343]|uniref:hypothetical protein n=1 Tax=Parasediminibacterium sp. JCM 36343 TaxID=3374279 RepID=UPI0039796A7A
MKKIIFFAIACFCIAGCYYDKADVINPNAAAAVCDTTSVTYSKDIQAIISQNCYSCHSGSANNGGGYQYDSYDMLKTYITSNPGVLQSDINWTSNPMPKSASKLSACNINKISAWINKGLPQ